MKYAITLIIIAGIIAFYGHRFTYTLHSHGYGHYKLYYTLITGIGYACMIGAGYLIGRRLKG